MAALDDFWNEIRLTLGTTAIRVYPSIPSGELVTVARWPNDDWRAFIQLAIDLGSGLVYADMLTFDETELQRLEPSLADDTGDASAELILARTRTGDPMAVQLAFSHDGVLHEWTAEADWYRDLTAHAVLEREVTVASRRFDFEQEREAADSFTKQSQGWDRQLAEHPDFLAARNEHDRRVIASRVVAALAPFLERKSTGPNLVFSRALRLVDRAWALARDEVLPHRLAEARANVEEVAASIKLDPDYAAATRKDDRLRLVRRQIESQYGLRDPDLVRLIEEATRRET